MPSVGHKDPEWIYRQYRSNDARQNLRRVPAYQTSHGSMLDGENFGFFFLDARYRDHLQEGKEEWKRNIEA